MATILLTIKLGVQMKTLPLSSNFSDIKNEALRNYEGREIMFINRSSRPVGTRGFIKSINIGSRSAKIMCGPNDIIEQSLEVLYLIPATKEELVKEKAEIESSLEETIEKLQFIEESGIAQIDTLRFQVDRIRKKIAASNPEEVTDILTKLIKRDE